MNLIFENFLQAMQAIRANILRTSLTILIIAFGIMAIIGVLTSIDGVKFWMASSFTTLGANTFKIQNRQGSVQIGGSRKKRIEYPNITWQEAIEIKNKLAPRDYLINISGMGNPGGKGKFQNNVTNPNIQIKGTDENFLIMEGYKIVEGRSLTREDVEMVRNVAVIGQELKERLFPYSSALDQFISLDRMVYKVIGVLEKRGSSFGGGGDKVAFIPVTTMRKAFPVEPSYVISVYSENPAEMQSKIEESTALFRIVRKLKPKDETNFVAVKAETFVASLMENLSILTISATGIAFITLFGASIGLMNIMLVSVTERTREIGLRKALGATKGQILFQFLTEAVVICQIGGLLGAIFGIGIGNLIGYFLGNEFFIPWAWIGLSVVICLVVGIGSGIYPARRASQLDPIIALRHS